MVIHTQADVRAVMALMLLQDVTEVGLVRKIIMAIVVRMVQMVVHHRAAKHNLTVREHIMTDTTQHQDVMVVG